jgi:hypothetical protein
LFLAFLMAFVGLRPAFAAVVNLSNNNRDDNNPRINSAGQVVWEGWDGADWEVYLWNGISIQHLSAGSDTARDPQIDSAGNVVWQGWNGSEWQIYRWDGSTAQELNRPGEDLFAQISACGYVVWQGWGAGSDYEIHLWNGTTIQSLTSNATDDFRPQINSSGQVAWSGWDGTTDTDIFFWDGSVVQKLTSNNVGDNNPRINDAGWVVWEGWDGNDYEIFLWNGSSIQQLTNNDWDDLKPQINSTGQVVWEGGDGTGDWEIYRWNGSTVTQLTNNGPTQWDRYPQINDAGQVTWMSYDGTDYEIYLWNGTATLQLTNNGRDDVFPQINSAGQVVWKGHDGVDWEIYLYTPTRPAALVLTPATLPGGQSASGTVTLNEPAPSGGLLVTLSSAKPSAVAVPASITVPAGMTSASFTATTSPVTGSVGVLVSATAGGVTQSTSLQVRRPYLKRLTLSSDAAGGNSSVTGTVNLLGAAFSGGIVISLSSANPAVASVPATVTVPAGATSATFPVTTSTVSSTTPVVLTASWLGVNPTATLTVLPVAPQQVTVTPTALSGGQSAAGSVILSGPAPTGGLVVSLSGSFPSAVSLPSSIIVPAGATSAPFTVTTYPVTASANVVVTASYGGCATTTTLVVWRPALKWVGLSNSSTVVGGGSVTGTVNLLGVAFSGGVVIALSSANSAVASVPATVTVPAGATSATFPITTSTVSSTTPVVLTASWMGAAPTATLIVTP